MELEHKNPWKFFRGSFRSRGSFRGCNSVEAFVKASVGVTSAASSTTSMEASVKAFVEDTSMKAFPKASVKASGIFFPWKLPYLPWKLSLKLHGSFLGSYGSFHGIGGSFYGRFHELPRKKQVVQETAPVAWAAQRYRAC